MTNSYRILWPIAAVRNAPPLDQETKWPMSWIANPPDWRGWLFDKGDADGWPNYWCGRITAAVVGPWPL